MTFPKPNAKNSVDVAHLWVPEMNGTNRRDIRIGTEVQIVQKHHQRTGELTEGVVQQILTNSAHHPHGIKVRLETGEVGRVKHILSDAE